MGSKLAGVTLAVMIINVLSRGIALVANSAVTATFGANALTGAYSFAITLAGIITTVIGTTLTTSVIPIYTDLREKTDEKRTNSFLNNTFSLTVIVSLALILICSLLAPVIASIAGKGDLEFSAFAIRVLLFSILFMSLFYIFSGILQANGRFFLAASVSIPSSMCSMLYIMTLSEKFGIHGLVFATLTGYFVQAAILLPAMPKTGWRFKLSFSYKNEDMYKIFAVIAPVIVGICAHQVNILANSSIAFRYDVENYVVLNNAQNLGVQIVLTMTLAVASVVYPKLSFFSAKEDNKSFTDCLVATMNGIILLLVPLSFGFFIYGEKFIDLIYGYGKFTSENVKLGGSIFSIYAVGILGLGFKEITDRAFYARKNQKESAFNGVVIMAVNIILSIILVKPFGLRGIAAAYSAAALTGGINIIVRFRKKYKDLPLKPLIIAFAKAFAASAAMAAVIYVLRAVIPFPEGKSGVLLEIAVPAICGMVVYGIILILLKTKEINNFIKRREKNDN